MNNLKINHEDAKGPGSGLRRSHSAWTDFDEDTDTDGEGMSKSTIENNTWLGIRIKKEFGLTQFILLPIISVVTVIVGVYMNT